MGQVGGCDGRKQPPAQRLEGSRSGAARNGGACNEASRRAASGTAAHSYRVRGMYFSGTGTTRKIVTAVAAQLASDLNQEKAPDIDFTPPGAREEIYRFDDRDILVFGVPVIAGRVPNVLLPFLKTLEGDGAMAVPLVLYGNRNFDDALIELRDILEEQGFYTVAAAAFIGEHSFSRRLAAGRPDASDMRIAEAFAGKVAEKIAGLMAAARQGRMLEKHSDVFAEKTEGILPCGQTGRDLQLSVSDLLENIGPIPVDGQVPLRPYYKPRDRKGNHINILKVKPKLDKDKCVMCGVCVDVCPMGSIHEEKPGLVQGICIKCCGCEKACPQGALYFDDPGYLYHKEELELGYPERKEPKLFL